MKKAILTLALILMATTAQAQFTAEQEANLILVADNIDKLIKVVAITDKLQAITDAQGSEALPLEIAKKRVEYKNKIQEMEDAKLVVKEQALTDMDAIQATFEPQIDAITSQINALQTTLEGLSQ